jgi:uncharacterized membrane protein
MQPGEAVHVELLEPAELHRISIAYDWSNSALNALLASSPAVSVVSMNAGETSQSPVELSQRHSAVVVVVVALAVALVVALVVVVAAAAAALAVENDNSSSSRSAEAPATRCAICCSMFVVCVCDGKFGKSL